MAVGVIRTKRMVAGPMVAAIPADRTEAPTAARTVAADIRATVDRAARVVSMAQAAVLTVASVEGPTEALVAATAAAVEVLTVVVIGKQG